MSERTWFPVSSGILTPEHVRRVGPALWVFLWFIHHERKPKDSLPGLVDDGRPITYQEISEGLGIPLRTIPRLVVGLEHANYLRSEKVGTSGRGKRYFITNPIRWSLNRLRKNEQSETERVRTSAQSPQERLRKNEQTEYAINDDRLRKNEQCNKEQRTKEHKEQKQERSASRRFTRPSLEEVTAYCTERNNGIDPQRFLDHYDANGWKRGRTPIRDWRACVRTWEQNEQFQHVRSNGNSSGKMSRAQTLAIRNAAILGLIDVCEEKTQATATEKLGLLLEAGNGA